VVEPGEAGAGLTIVAADLGETIAVRDAPADHPLAAAARLPLVKLGLHDPDWRLTVHSTIPIASGMGSGAAVSAAVVRALAVARGQEVAISYQLSAISPEEVSALVYAVERLHHGTPSGIDNTVVVYGQPVYFVRGQPPQTFRIGQPFMLAIADTGIHSPTKVAVGDVRRAWEREPARFEALFDRVAAIAEAARSAIAAGEPERLGPLMDENHALLREIGVSCPELDALVAAARGAGALGAKLSGGGRGGNMIALVTEAAASQVADALRAAGAVSVIVSIVRTGDI
jgi:mevalonate kinase